MTRDSSALATRGLRIWSASAAALAVLAGGTALVGGWLDRAIATGFVLGGLALGALWASPGPSRRRLADVAAGLLLLIGVVEIVRGHAGLAPLCFVLIAASLLTVDRRAVFPTGQRLAVAAGFIAFLSVVTYAYRAGVLRADAYAAALLVVLAAGVTAVRPGRGASGILVPRTAGGTVARWLIPATILGPFVIGAAAMAGARAGHYELDFGMAFVTAANSSIFTALAWLLAVRLHRTDARRLAAEAALRQTNAELEERVRIRTSELVASERQYRGLIEDSAEGIIIHRAGLVRFVNAAGLRIYGYQSAAEVLGTPIMDRVSPEHRAAVAARVEARLRGEPTPSTVEFEGIRRDGTRFWIEATGTAIEWEGGPATLVAFLDISERHRREAAERETASLRSVTRLANAAAHEINNPLTVVQGHLQLAAAKVAGRPEVDRHFEQAERGVRRIAEMIDHMTRITRLEPLTDIDTAGVDTLDLRRSSEPPPEPA